MRYNKVNTKVIHKLLLLASFFCSFPLTSNAQNLDSPINPIQEVVYDWELGGFLGIGANFSGGEYHAECPECIFSKNSKFGYSIGLKMDHEVTRNFYIGTNLIFDDLSTDGSFLRYEDIPLERADGSTMNASVEFRHTLNLSLQSIALAPNAIWRIDDWLDLRLGIYGSLILSNNVKHTKELLTKTALLPDGEKVNVSFQNVNGNKVVLEDRAIPDLSTFQFGIFPQINFNIPLSDDNDFLIGSYMEIPFSSLASSQSGYNNYVWRFFIGLSFDLNNDEKYRNRLDEVTTPTPVPKKRK